MKITDTKTILALWDEVRLTQIYGYPEAQTIAIWQHFPASELKTSFQLFTQKLENNSFIPNKKTSPILQASCYISGMLKHRREESEVIAAEIQQYQSGVPRG